MQENNIDNELSFKDYMSVLKRHSNLFFWSIAPIVTIGVAIAFGLPTIYESSGTIIVEQQEISEDVITTTVNSLADERVSVTTQRVMTVERLGGVINQYSLYPDLSGLRPKVAELKRNVAVEILQSDVIRSPMGPARNNVVFSVTYGHPSPVLARDVSRDLVDLYLNESRRARQDLASQATTFLQQQADRLKKEIETKEAGASAIQVRKCVGHAGTGDFHRADDGSYRAGSGHDRAGNPNLEGASEPFGVSAFDSESLQRVNRNRWTGRA